MVDQDVRTNLLVDIAIAGAPAEDAVVAARAVDGGLRVDGKKAELVHARELLRDGRRLRAELLLRPRQSLDLAPTPLREELADVLNRLRLAPQSVRVFHLCGSREQG